MVTDEKTGRKFVVKTEPDNGGYSFTPEVNWEAFKDTPMVKEREGAKFEDYLHKSAQDKKNFQEKMDDNWVKI